MRCARCVPSISAAPGSSTSDSNQKSGRPTRDARFFHGAEFSTPFPFSTGKQGSLSQIDRRFAAAVVGVDGIGIGYTRLGFLLPRGVPPAMLCAAGGIAAGLPMLYRIKSIKFVLAFCPGGCYNVPIPNTTAFPESGAVVIKIPVAFAILIAKAPRQNRKNQP